jgi:chemotaxis protein MotA
MDDLKRHRYLNSPRKKFDPAALLISAAALGALLYGVSDSGKVAFLLDMKSVMVVFGGTFASLLFQFDFSGTWSAVRYAVGCLGGTPDRYLHKITQQLDDAILGQLRLVDLADGTEITGEFLNDVVCMAKNGLLYEEIEQLLSSRIQDTFLKREIAVTIFNRGAMIAPAFGLFGTVIGLVGVLRNLSQPGSLGPSMSLALMTTAYGSALGSLLFTPLAGRLQHHNGVYLDCHRQMLAKIRILMKRDEREFSDNPTMEEAV